jgi:phosphoribulokinase
MNLEDKMKALRKVMDSLPMTQKQEYINEAVNEMSRTVLNLQSLYIISDDKANELIGRYKTARERFILLTK